MDSLKFLNKRAAEEGLDNIDLLCGDIRKVGIFKNRFDVAIVNGVLEWIPEEGSIELKSYFGKFSQKRYAADPGRQQMEFLKKVHQNLKAGGKLYLAIENRFDAKMFLGINDPHANMPLVSVLPRALASCVSFMMLGRPYVNWLYSFNGIRSLLKRSGFSAVELYMSFPDYRFPERIIPYTGSLKDIPEDLIYLKSGNANNKKPFIKKAARKIYNGCQWLTYKFLNIRRAAPSIIAIGYK